jgi:hypothetical protein
VGHPETAYVPAPPPDQAVPLVTLVYAVPPLELHERLQATKMELLPNKVAGLAQTMDQVKGSDEDS